jgi:hypothetical protein
MPPYVPQGMAGVNLVGNFEEEHIMETPSLPRYKTRARSRQHSANQAQILAPCVSCPIKFTNTQGFHASPKQANTHIHMANNVINQDTGSSLECRQLIQDETTFPVWNQASSNELGACPKVIIEGFNTIFFIPRQAIHKRKIVTYGRFVVDIRPNKTETH